MIKAKINPASRARFLADIKEFKKRTGKSTEDVVDMIAISAGRGLMTKTLPMGLRAKSDAKGKASSGEDFSHSIAAQIIRALKKNITAVRHGASIAAVHAGARGSRGSVDKSKRDDKSRMYPLPPARTGEIDQYIEKMQRRAGMAKAGWLVAAKEIGDLRKGTIPGYVKRHLGKGGLGNASRRGKGLGGYTVTLANNAKHMNSRLISTGSLRSALTQAYKSVRWELDKVLNGGKPKTINIKRRRT